MPADPSVADALRRAALALRRARAQRLAAPSRVQLPGGEAQLAEVVRVLDQADLHVASLQLHQPSLDDVFLAKTGRKLEGAGEDAR